MTVNAITRPTPAIASAAYVVGSHPPYTEPGGIEKRPRIRLLRQKTAKLPQPGRVLQKVTTTTFTITAPHDKGARSVHAEGRIRHHPARITTRDVSQGDHRGDTVTTIPTSDLANGMSGHETSSMMAGDDASSRADNFANWLLASMPPRQISRCPDKAKETFLQHRNYHPKKFDGDRQERPTKSQERFGSCPMARTRRCRDVDKPCLDQLTFDGLIANGGYGTQQAVEVRRQDSADRCGPAHR